MFFCAEFHTITQTLRARFPQRAQESPGTSHHHGTPHIGDIWDSTSQRREFKQWGIKHRDTALYNKSTLFPSKGEGISTFFFFLNYRFHNGNVDRYLSSFSGSVLLTQATSLSTFAGTTFLFRAGLALPPCRCSLPCDVERASAVI